MLIQEYSFSLQKLHAILAIILASYFQMTIVSVVDTETTGVKEGSGLVEYAAIHVELDPTSLVVLNTTSHTFLVNPGVEIPPEASAVRHLTLDHLTKAISHDDAKSAIIVDLSNSDYVVAHNSAFDSRFVSTDKPWLCTYRVARHLLDAPSYSDQSLRYRLGLKPQLPENLSAHRALYDVIVTVELFLHLLKLSVTLEEFHRLTNTPILEKTLNFGAHRGKKFEDIPTSYLVWLQTLEDRSPDFKATVAQHLAKRRGG